MLTVDALTRASVEANTARAQILGSFNSQLLYAARSMGIRFAISNPEEDRNSPYYFSSFPSSLAGGARVKRVGKPLGLLASSLSVPALLRPRRRELHYLSDEYRGWVEQLLDDDSDETANENDDNFDSV
jgi:hypothetical protein